MPRFARSKKKFSAGIILFLTGLTGTILFVLLEAARQIEGSGLENLSGYHKEKTQAAIKPAKNPAEKPKYSKFSHDIEAHKKKECSTCHTFPSSNWQKVREKDSAFPDITDYPKHASCINCHRQQFFRGSTPAICAICHTNPSPRNSRRHPFPNPRELFDVSPKGRKAGSEFDVAFVHSIHVDIVSGLPRHSNFINAAWPSGISGEPGALRRKKAGGAFLKAAWEEESCSVCHATLNPEGDSGDEYFSKPPADLGDGFWLKKGAFKSSPTGHAKCFTCHSADSGITPAPSDCGTCHKLKQQMPQADFDSALAARIGVTERILLDAWKTRTSSGTFRHEWFSHAELSCSTCHDVSSIVTTDPGTRKVNIASCNNCHITATTDDGGVLNFEIDSRMKNPGFQCVKCHISYGSKPIPESHTKAIAALAGN